MIALMRSAGAVLLGISSSFDRTAVGERMKILDLGCGNKKYAGAVGIDMNPLTDADIIHDLNSIPYPFEDSVFDEIIADNIIEHLDNIILVMEELSRISKVGATIKVIVPYFRSKWAYIDPTHKHFFTVDSFAYFDPDNIISKLYKYTQVRYKVSKVIFNENLKNGFIKSLVIFLANKWPVRYETYLSHLFALDDLTFYLINLKR
jgi:SAM-dependent methyltransferase